MRTANYPDEVLIKDALQIYFAKYHFDSGGYNDKYFKIKIGSVFIPVPNTKSRLKAVRFHDIHHLLTEYPALWKGEVEIAAWEIASSCGKFLIAWLLNFGSFAIGLFLYPVALYKAFMTGRSVNNNLYHNYIYDDHLLNRTLGELRKEMGIGLPKNNTFQDKIYFICITLLILSVILAPVLLLYHIFKL